ncbi:general odorant-binding protein 45-like [Aedes albopictus]|uniref:Secreted protein n=1 Tax=Aedes albopictus TaxID=7160 RepID=A0ABM1XJ56_AEDAL|nr:general odorant-binding protein 45-like [Aedes albopictus]
MIIILVGVALFGGVFGAGQHDAVFKSIASTGGECARYLNNDGTGDCNTHCVAVVDHVWNDTVAMFTRNYERFFVPVPDDQCYQNRTLRCLAQVDSVVPVADKCARAQQLGQCYADQHGQLNASQLFYRPMTNIQYNRVFQQCASMLGLSNDDLKEMAAKGVQNVAASACLMRCLWIRMGIYSDDVGFDLTLATGQCGKYNPAMDPVPCQARLVAEECDKCKRAIRQAQECLDLRFSVQQLDESQPPQLKFNLEIYDFNCILICDFEIDFS